MFKVKQDTKGLAGGVVNTVTKVGLFTTVMYGVTSLLDKGFGNLFRKNIPLRVLSVVLEEFVGYMVANSVVYHLSDDVDDCTEIFVDGLFTVKQESEKD